jgi:glycosyltransferase involved in cell wall biosynthesis
MLQLKTKLIEILVFYICCTALLAEALNLFLRRKRKTVSQNDVICTEDIGDCAENSTVSIVMAVKNEAGFIGKTLRNLEATTIDKSRCQVIFVDAGCTDNSADVAKASSCCIPLIFVKSLGGIGRGAAMNAGAEKATGEILLFLRSDCLVTPGYDTILRREFFRGPDLLVSFSYSIDRENLKYTNIPGLWLWECFINLRSKYCSLPTGYQGLAVTKKTFSEFKFPDSIVLEDLSYVMAFRKDRGKSILP